jgi:hypothetical protein
MNFTQNVLNIAYRSAIANDMLELGPKFIDVSVVSSSVAYRTGGRCGK